MRSEGDDKTGEREIQGVRVSISGSGDEGDLWQGRDLDSTAAEPEFCQQPEGA